MLEPDCPSCRERMSDVEFGLSGVWSCLYCEGVWLPHSQVAALAQEAAQAGCMASKRFEPRPAPTDDAPVSPRQLRCPDCGSQAFAVTAARTVHAYGCTACRGLFLPKDAVERLVDELPIQPWFGASVLRRVAAVVALEFVGLAFVTGP